jgi:hypothetical protein
MHRNLLLLVVCSIISLQLIAQPLGYTPGTQVCWTFNGRPHGYFKAAGNGERHILISFTGDGENSCGNYATNAPQKFLNGTWNGKTVRAPGDTIVWEVFTITHTSGNYIPAYASDIDYFFQNIAPIDTSDHTKFHIEGLSGGVGRLWGYVSNDQNHNSPYRHIFSTTISMATPWLNTFGPKRAYSIGRRHWVWHGTADGGCCSPGAGQQLYDSILGTKHLTLQAGSGHGHSTYDSCLSLNGTDTTTNRWLWMVKVDSIPVDPGDPGDTCTQGPPGYVRGTQVCWTFNGRPHGYFKAAGNGERHILISFTGDGLNDCSNYATNAPQKFLNGTWDGRTVRAPGDTIVWEVLTIAHTSSYYLPDYASDINYFFANICPIDTSDHSKFHIMGLSGGVGRMWGFVSNDQSHNSPYRDLFSTTISMSTPWLNTFGPKRAYSIGRRHWVWHGTADGGSTPPGASQQLYDSILGTKHLTLQVGGGHNATTWDSCLSLNGTDTTTNRWLWMVANSGGGLRMMTSGDVPQTAPTKGMTLLYPNPGRNKVIINTGDLPADAYTVTIIDVMGRVHKVIRNIRDRYYPLDISALQKGIYFIQVQTGNYKVQRKLVKQ